MNLPVKQKKAVTTKRENVGAKMKNKTCIAFDFGTFATKVVVARVRPHASRVMQMFTLENVGGTSMESSDTSKIKNNIKKALRQNGVFTSGQNAICMVDSTRYTTREIVIPPVEERDMAGIVSNEFAQSLSVNVEDYYFQYRVLGTEQTGNRPMQRVSVSAIKKEIGDLYYDIISSIGLYPLCLDNASNGLLRYVSSVPSMNDNSSTVAFVDYGMNSTRIYMFTGGQFIESTIVGNGDVRLVTAVKNMYGMGATSVHNPNKLSLSPKEVYDLINSSAQNASSHIVVNVVEEWLAEINSVVKRYNLNHPTSPVSSICLYGGSPNLSWLKLYVERYLGASTQIVNLLGQISLSSKIAAEENKIPQFFNALNLYLIK